MCEALIGYHAFSGCDSTSAFVGQGKAKGHKLLHDHRPFRSTMAKLGKSFVADEVLLQEGEAAGHTMFGLRTIDPAKLPPCKDACDQHIKRANYQAAIWWHCLAARPSVPSSHGNGWTVDGDILVDWMDSPAAPQAVPECVSCKCKKCAGARCSCKLNRLTCTGACRCDADDCENRLVTPTDMDVDPLLSEDDSDME